MGRQQIKQAARKTALEGQELRRRERAAQDKRLEGLAVEVLVALAERDEAVRKAEARAGVAVRSMLGEGLSAAEVAQCCGARVGVREVRRLAQVTGEPAGDNRSDVPACDNTSDVPASGSSADGEADDRARSRGAPAG